MDDKLYEKIKEEIDNYIDQGINKSKAIIMVSKKYHVNPYKIFSKCYPELKSQNNDNNEDKQIYKGSYVVLKGDLDKKQYEVINTSNTNAIILRDIKTNKEVIASETELTPVIMENNMKKIKEAQYNVSINDLETNDADALSQIFSLASQAETADEATSEENIPTPMDIDTGMPMEMGDDIDFDQDLPADTDIDALSMDDMLDMGMYEPVDSAPVDSLEDEETFTPSDDVVSDDEFTSDEFDSGLPDDEFMGGEVVDGEDMSLDMDSLDDEIAEALKIAGVKVNEAEEIIPGEDDDEDEEDDGSEKGEQEKFAEELTENDLNISITADNGDDIVDFDEEKSEESEKDSVDDEILETLRIAGVEIDEIVDDSDDSEEKTEEKSEEKEEEDSSDEYHEVDDRKLDEKSGCLITCESTINKAKIKSIYETAKRMYAKKDVSEWNSLDRRYIEKLIREGCSYSTSTKMLMEAKKGK